MYPLCGISFLAPKPAAILPPLRVFVNAKQICMSREVVYGGLLLLQHPHRRFQQLTRRLNASLKELLYYREVGFGLQLGRWWIKERWQRRRPDYLAIEYILGLLKDGRLDRLRQCEMCLKWFVAWQTSQTTCGERCRRQHYKTDPKFRMKRAKYMREEYRPRFPSRRGRSSHE
jgi:hypothetical protein